MTVSIGVPIPAARSAGMGRGADAASLDSSTRYRLRLASSAEDLTAAQALRFAVFNVEHAQGLLASYESGLDADPFDEVCDHLLVEDLQDETVVGTYRLQTGTRAQFGLGFYSAQAFDFTPYASRRHELLELGRACIHADHRHFAVLNLLWSGIARYAQQREVRYLIGCSSLNSTEAADAAAVMLQLAKHRAEPAWWTRPLPRYALALDAVQPSRMRVPRLLAAYLAMGARICAEPALDAEFGSIDFLTWIDLQSPALQALRERGRFGA